MAESSGSGIDESQVPELLEDVALVYRQAVESLRITAGFTLDLESLFFDLDISDLEIGSLPDGINGPAHLMNKMRTAINELAKDSVRRRRPDLRNSDPLVKARYDDIMSQLGPFGEWMKESLKPPTKRAFSVQASSLERVEDVLVRLLKHGRSETPTFNKGASVGSDLSVHGIEYASTENVERVAELIGPATELYTLWLEKKAVPTIETVYLITKAGEVIIEPAKAALKVLEDQLPAFARIKDLIDSGVVTIEQLRELNTESAVAQSTAVSEAITDAVMAYRTLSKYLVEQRVLDRDALVDLLQDKNMELVYARNDYMDQNRHLPKSERPPEKFREGLEDLVRSHQYQNQIMAWFDMAVGSLSSLLEVLDIDLSTTILSAEEMAAKFEELVAKSGEMLEQIDSFVADSGQLAYSDLTLLELNLIKDDLTKMMGELLANPDQVEANVEALLADPDGLRGPLNSLVVQVGELETQLDVIAFGRDDRKIIDGDRTVRDLDEFLNSMFSDRLPAVENAIPSQVFGALHNATDRLHLPDSLIPSKDSLPMGEELVDTGVLDDMGDRFKQGFVIWEEIESKPQEEQDRTRAERQSNKVPIDFFSTVEQSITFLEACLAGQRLSHLAIFGNRPNSPRAAYHAELGMAGVDSQRGPGSEPDENSNGQGL